MAFVWPALAAILVQPRWFSTCPLEKVWGALSPWPTSRWCGSFVLGFPPPGHARRCVMRARAAIRALRPTRAVLIFLGEALLSLEDDTADSEVLLHFGQFSMFLVENAAASAVAPIRWSAVCELLRATGGTPGPGAVLARVQPAVAFAVPGLL